MRGKLIGVRLQCFHERIIPAHAGQTSSCKFSTKSPTDHPRACGANFHIQTDTVPENGSSPRMRGKRLRIIQDREHIRIIPAHAGQTTPTTKGSRAPTDHPRACGANSGQVGDGHLLQGSSPRMRGKLGDEPIDDAADRIIPAHAGQTWSMAVLSCSRTDHPRACGANDDWLENDRPLTGSSPRMRGKRLAEGTYLPKARIIPAHAGQTS